MSRVEEVADYSGGGRSQYGRAVLVQTMTAVDGALFLAIDEVPCPTGDTSVLSFTRRQRSNTLTSLSFARRRRPVAAVCYHRGNGGCVQGLAQGAEQSARQQDRGPLRRHRPAIPHAGRLPGPLVRHRSTLSVTDVRLLRGSQVAHGQLFRLKRLGWRLTRSVVSVSSSSTSSLYSSESPHAHRFAYKCFLVRIDVDMHAVVVLAVLSKYSRNRPSRVEGVSIRKRSKCRSRGQGVAHLFGRRGHRTCRKNHHRFLGRSPPVFSFVLRLFNH